MKTIPFTVPGSSSMTSLRRAENGTTGTDDAASTSDPGSPLHVQPQGCPRRLSSDSTGLGDFRSKLHL